MPSDAIEDDAGAVATVTHRVPVGLDDAQSRLTAWRHWTRELDADVVVRHGRIDQTACLRPRPGHLLERERRARHQVVHRIVVGGTGGD